MLLLFLALPGATAAASAVPPGNSAVDQYTEGIPGPSGNLPTGTPGGKTNPAQALGARNAQRLKHFGSAGRAAAEIAAATAPARQYGAGSGPAGSAASGKGDSAASGTAGSASSGKGDSAASGTAGSASSGKGDSAASGTAGSAASPSAGSSGFAEVLKRAVGVDQSGSSIFLPLVLGASLLAAIAILLGRRRRTT